MLFIKKILLCIFIAVCVTVSHAHSCSSFVFNNNSQLLFGKNYDWMIEDGMLVINKRNMAKTAITISGTQPISWVSRHGSITFNQCGREMPSGGMNEMGLVIELMWLDDAEYPTADSRPTLTELQWIQYQLDTASNVQEVIASDSEVRIAPDSMSHIHFLVCDSSGDCAAIEFLNGRMVTHRREEMPVTVLTNHPYTASVEFLRQHLGFGGENAIPGGPDSLDRFVRIAAHKNDDLATTHNSAIEHAFNLLKDVVADNTKWSIVYDISARQIHFHTASNSSLRSVCMEMFSFECDTPVKVLDINAKIEGDITSHFITYDYSINRDLIDRVFDQTEFLRQLPEEVRDELARYPESTRCASDFPSRDTPSAH